MSALRPLARFVRAALILATLCPTTQAQELFGLPGSGVLPLGAGSSTGAVVGDFDGDGDPDILLAGTDGRGEGYELWMCQPGGRYLRSGVAFPPNSGYGLIAGAVAADFDADGDLDIVLAAGLAFELWLNDGAGRFASAAGRIPPAIRGGRVTLLAGDFDSDGDVDIIGESWDTILWLNDGTGTFADAPAPPQYGYLGGACVGDVDGDGDLDFLAGSAGYCSAPCGWLPAIQPRLWINDGSANFSDATLQLPQQLAYVTSVAMADIDGDGDLDALLANGSIGTPDPQMALGGQDLLWLNDGSGNFTDASAQLPPSVEFTSGVALIDLDGDGSPDLLRCSGADAGRRSIWLNDGSGRFASNPSRMPVAAATYGTVVPVDADLDGDLDVVLAGGQVRAYSAPRLWLNDGSGGLVDVRYRDAGPFGAPGAAALGDLDGDGDVDALFGDRVRRNLGNGYFEDTIVPLPSGTPAAAPAVALADLDGNGTLDAIVARAGQTELWFNAGASFRDATAQLPLDNDSTTTVLLEDFDGDGDLDIFLGNEGAQNRLWLNNPGLVFTDATFFLPQVLDQTRGAKAGDVDGDGDLDLFVANFTPSSRLLINNGAGAFSDAASRIPYAGAMNSVDLADLDLDGDLDVMLGGARECHPAVGCYTYPSQLWLNDGTGSFVDASGSLPATLGVGVRMLALEDVDGDGDKDAIFAGSGDTQVVALWLNHAGTFTDVSSRLAPIGASPFGFAVGDLDEDGDLDILSGGRVLKNLTRQLASPMPPRVGKLLQLDVYGSPNASYLLIASAGRGRLALGALGTLLVDPTPVALLGVGALDPTGRGSFQSLVPSTPWLVGASIYWQAVVDGVPHMTNLEITTFTDL